MRGKAIVYKDGGATVGITPAHAGKSHGLPTAAQGGWDHPRMCGEKGNAARRCSSASGSPPRVRGKVQPAGSLHTLVGITPACAGKSSAKFLRRTSARDHPRMCGEKSVMEIIGTIAMGSPPRMRGKVVGSEELPGVVGITPAYAGKSHPACPERSRTVDHPRVCGEKNQNLEWADSVLGSPPRVRGKADHTRHLVHLSFLRA